MNSNAALLVVVLAVAGTVLAEDPPNPEYTDFFAEAIEECKNCVGSTDEDIANANVRGPLSSSSQECLQYCMYHKVGAQDGVEYDIETAVDVYNIIHQEYPQRLEQADDTVRMCTEQGKEQGGNDPCKVAAFTQACFRSVDI